MSLVLDKIIENASKNPERVAYICEEQSITWKELDEKSNKLASYFLETLSDKTPVVVYGHKHPFMIVAFLACVKSGRAYVPVDITFPNKRISDVIEAVNPEIVLTVDNNLPVETAKRILEVLEFEWEGNEESSLPSDCGVKGEDVHYIIFTSGSTGTPKGVQITADCLDNFVKWAITLGSEKIMEGDKHLTFINQAPFSFDLSVFDLYLSLYTGGTLYTIPKAMQSDMKNLYAYLGKSGANVWVSTPSFAEIATSDECFSKELLPELKLFLFCGETLTNQTAKKLYDRFPKAEVVNTYGPTESTVAMTEIVVTDDVMEKYNPLPIGNVKPGTYVYIMDEDGNILPDEEKGEIVIVGDTVSVGYWNNPEKNAEVFGTMNIDGVEYRLYHTHDKGYYKDGVLFYCGRIDLQIKLHGYRIELEDIESNILAVSNVERVVVMPDYSEANEVIGLTAYVVSKEKIESALKERSRIRKALESRIPEYMIPKKFVFKDSLPVTNNGKVDRRKLREQEEC